MNAGLTCPDWPLCFGKAVPEFHFGVYLEFIHRVIAGLVGLAYLVFFVQVLRKPELKKLRALSWIGLFFLLAQILMGGLTVLKFLDAYIVTMHLSLATAFLLTLFIMKKVLAFDPTQTSPLPDTKFSALFRFTQLVAIFFVLVQIVLGGLVASTYSGLVCIDFPTCNGQYFPPLQGPIGIQMVHRFGAYWLSLLITCLFVFSIFSAKKLNLKQRHRKIGVSLFFLVCTQVFIGVMNLKYLMPAFLSVFHLAIALTILITLINFYFSTKSARHLF